MSRPFPDFNEPAAIDATRAWTARFDSYDDLLDDCYYVVMLYEHGQPAGQFMVQLTLWDPRADRSSPEFAEHLRAELQTLAASGHTNTRRRGSVADWLAQHGAGAD